MSGQPVGGFTHVHHPHALYNICRLTFQDSCNKDMHNKGTSESSALGQVMVASYWKPCRLCHGPHYHGEDWA